MAYIQPTIKVVPMQDYAGAPMVFRASSWNKVNIEIDNTNTQGIYGDYQVSIMEDYKHFRFFTDESILFKWSTDNSFYKNIINNHRTTYWNFTFVEKYDVIGETIIPRRKSPYVSITLVADVSKEPLGAEINISYSIGYIAGWYDDEVIMEDAYYNEEVVPLALVNSYQSILQKGISLYLKQFADGSNWRYEYDIGYNNNGTDVTFMQGIVYSNYRMDLYSCKKLNMEYNSTLAPALYGTKERAITLHGPNIESIYKNYGLYSWAYSTASPFSNNHTEPLLVSPYNPNYQYVPYVNWYASYSGGITTTYNAALSIVSSLPIEEVDIKDSVVLDMGRLPLTDMFNYTGVAYTQLALPGIQRTGTTGAGVRLSSYNSLHPGNWSTEVMVVNDFDNMRIKLKIIDRAAVQDANFYVRHIGDDFPLYGDENEWFLFWYGSTVFQAQPDDIFAIVFNETDGVSFSVSVKVYRANQWHDLTIGLTEDPLLAVSNVYSTLAIFDAGHTQVSLYKKVFNDWISQELVYAYKGDMEFAVDDFLAEARWLVDVPELLADYPIIGNVSEVSITGIKDILVMDGYKWFYIPANPAPLIRDLYQYHQVYINLNMPTIDGYVQVNMRDIPNIDTYALSNMTLDDLLSEDIDFELWPFSDAESLHTLGKIRIMRHCNLSSVGLRHDKGRFDNLGAPEEVYHPDLYVTPANNFVGDIDTVAETMLFVVSGRVFIGNQRHDRVYLEGAYDEFNRAKQKAITALDFRPFNGFDVIRFDPSDITVLSEDNLKVTVKINVIGNLDHKTPLLVMNGWLHALDNTYRFINHNVLIVTIDKVRAVGLDIETSPGLLDWISMSVNGSGLAYNLATFDVVKYLTGKHSAVIAVRDPNLLKIKELVRTYTNLPQQATHYRRVTGMMLHHDGTIAQQHCHAKDRDNKTAYWLTAPRLHNYVMSNNVLVDNPMFTLTEDLSRPVIEEVYAVELYSIV